MLLGKEENERESIFFVCILYIKINTIYKSVFLNEFYIKKKKKTETKMNKKRQRKCMENV